MAEDDMLFYMQKAKNTRMLYCIWLYCVASFLGIFCPSILCMYTFEKEGQPSSCNCASTYPYYICTVIGGDLKLKCIPTLGAPGKKGQFILKRAISELR